jgi:hypothetical protein
LSEVEADIDASSLANPDDARTAYPLIAALIASTPWPDFAAAMIFASRAESAAAAAAVHGV